MDDRNNPRNAMQKGAQKYFAKAAKDETLAKEISRKERNAGAAKINRLRELRLAKEAGEKAVADKVAAETPSKAPVAKRKSAAPAKPPKMLRMSY
jgi:hypothetical protein